MGVLFSPQQPLYRRACMGSKKTNIFNNLNIRDKSSRPDVFCKSGVLKNFAKFTGRHLCQSLFFIKATGRTPFHLFYRTLLVTAYVGTYKMPSKEILRIEIVFI